MADIKALLGLAAQHHEAGRLNQAESLYRQILASDPNDSDALYGLGTVAIAVNQAAAAVSLIGRAAAQEPRNATFLMNLGIAHSMLGQFDHAGEAFRAAISAAPGNLDARYNFGLYLFQTGSFADAAAQFRRIVDKQPQNVDALMNLAIACAKSGDFDEALRRLRRCVQIAPDNMEARYNLANVLNDSEAFAEAEAIYREILVRQPNHSGTHYNYANLLRETERFADAEVHYRRAIELDPKAVEPLVNLGNLMKLRRDWDETEALFREAVRVQPASSDAWRNLAGFEAYKGDVESAQSSFERAAATASDTELCLQEAVVLPVIAQSEEQIQSYRRRLEDRLAALASGPVSISNPTKVGARPFLLAYHGLDDRPIMEALGGIYRAATPSLSFTTKHCATYRGPKGKRVRVGFVSTHLYNHTIGRLNERLMVDLPRDRFEVFVFSTAGTNDATSRRIAAGAEHFVPVAAKLSALRETIAAAELDILYYTDIGMEPLTYFLAYARLAPVQCVTWGHPITPGLSTLDYFISSDLFETPDTESAYSETLVRFKGPSVSFVMPNAMGGPPVGDGPAFLCSQSLFKFHPEFDPILEGILDRCRDSELVVIEGEHPEWSARLKARWLRTIPAVAGRIKFVPRLSQSDFVSLLGSAKVVLDTPHFCGGMTSFETFAAGTPVVTLPGRYARGRLTLGYYRYMGIEDLVASDSRHYIDLAVRLAQDARYRADMSQSLRTKARVLADNPQPIAEHAAFFERAVAQAASR